MDYAILEIEEPSLRPLKLGGYNDVMEGSSIYIAGYPFGIDQSIISTGIQTTPGR